MPTLTAQKPSSLPAIRDDTMAPVRKAWREPGADTRACLGQRMLAADQDEYPLPDVRRIEVAPRA